MVNNAIVIEKKSRKWRWMARGRCHSMDSPLEAMLGPSSCRLLNSSNHLRWTGYKWKCRCSALNSRCNDYNSICRGQMLNCSDPHSRWTGRMYSNNHDRTRNQHFACRRLVPREPQATGYGPKNLDTGQFPPAANDWKTKYPILDMAPPVLAEEEGPPTEKD
jgi:hypothetical protein